MVFKTQPQRRLLRQDAAKLGAALLFMGWLHLAFTVVMPTLWGPYAFAFMTSGPVLLSFAGTVLVLGVAPVITVLMPLMMARSSMSWLTYQLGCLSLTVGLICAQGYYVHTIVHYQGIDASLAHISVEAGFESVEAVPAHLKQAFILSDRLAAEERAPWLPGEWRVVTWPAAYTDKDLSKPY